METQLILEVDPVIRQWRERLSSAGAKYAWIKTTKVLHDKAAVIEETEKNYVVEFPTRKESKGKGVWRIRKEVVAKDDVVEMRMYKEGESTSGNS